MIAFAIFFLPANCIIQVWNYGPALQPCRCPLCRRHITLLIPTEASLRQRSTTGVAEILEKVEHYNRVFGERPNGLFQVERSLYDLCINSLHFR